MEAVVAYETVVVATPIVVETATVLIEGVAILASIPSAPVILAVVGTGVLIGGLVSLFGGTPQPARRTEAPVIAQVNNPARSHTQVLNQAQEETKYSEMERQKIGALAAVKFMSSDSEDEEPTKVIHKHWKELKPYKGKTKRDVTVRIWLKSQKRKDTNDVYYYEWDYTHKDVEVYKKLGSKGVHQGSVKEEGGDIYKPAVPGRTIQL